MSLQDAIKWAFITGLFNIAGNLLAIFILDKVGKKKLF